MARVWWVNQGKSYADEHSQGIVFAATFTKNGRVLPHRAAIGALRPGDRILHYARGALRAIGTVTGLPHETRRPYSVPGKPDSDLGLMAPVAYRAFTQQIERNEIPLSLRLSEPAAGPFDVNGKVKQGYLFPLSRGFWREVSEQLHPRLD